MTVPVQTTASGGSEKISMTTPVTAQQKAGGYEVRPGHSQPLPPRAAPGMHAAAPGDPQPCPCSRHVTAAAAACWEPPGTLPDAGTVTRPCLRCPPSVSA